jgi:hypothetical protein
MFSPMYTLIIFIIYDPFGDVIMNHDLQLDVKSNFIYEIKTILVVNVGYNCFIIANWHFFFEVQPYSFLNPLDHAQIGPFPLSTLSIFIVEGGNPLVEGSW